MSVEPEVVTVAAAAAAAASSLAAPSSSWVDLIAWTCEYGQRVLCGILVVEGLLKGGADGRNGLVGKAMCRHVEVGEWEPRLDEAVPAVKPNPFMLTRIKHAMPHRDTRIHTCTHMRTGMHASMHTHACTRTRSGVCPAMAPQDHARAQCTLNRHSMHC